jgi:hypothetical protein
LFFLLGGHEVGDSIEEIVKRHWREVAIKCFSGPPSFANLPPPKKLIAIPQNIDLQSWLCGFVWGVWGWGWEVSGVGGASGRPHIPWRDVRTCLSNSNHATIKQAFVCMFRAHSGDDADGDNSVDANIRKKSGAPPMRS